MALRMLDFRPTNLNAVSKDYRHTFAHFAGGAPGPEGNPTTHRKLQGTGPPKGPKPGGQAVVAISGYDAQSPKYAV